MTSRRQIRLGLRVGWIVLLALLVLGTLGSGALAGRNLFDEDYTDCPSGTRLQALSNVRVMRTDEEDELKVSWDMTQPASWRLGPNVYSASITLILESDDKTITSDKALGSTSHTFEDLAQSTEWKVQVAVTDRGYVISDIVEADITSSAPAPWFDIPIWYGQPSAKTVAGYKEYLPKNRVGRFYYLGFNKEFRSWYITRDNGNAGAPDEIDSPADLTPKFRVGLRHNMEKPDLDEVDFDHFRVRVLDSGGDDMLGFDAKTVGNNRESPVTDLFKGSPLYQETQGNTPRVNQGWMWNVGNFPLSSFDSSGQYTPGSGDTIHFANYARSRKLENGGAPSIRSLFVTNPAYALGTTSATSSILEETKTMLSGAHIRSGYPSADAFASASVTYTGFHTFGPEGVYDLPADIFREDDNYTIMGWMENEDDEQISPRTSITFSARTVAYIAKTANLFVSRDKGSTWEAANYDTSQNDVRAHALALTILDYTNDDYIASITDYSKK